MARAYADIRYTEEPLGGGARLLRLSTSDFIIHHTPDASRDHIEAVALVTCELVTNSLRYETDPDDPVRLLIDTDGSRTRVEVHDPLNHHPRLRPISVERDRGRRRRD